MIHFKSALAIFALLVSNAVAQPPEHERIYAKGLDIELMSYGGSFGGFYRVYPNPALSIDVESDWSIIESNNTVSFYDYYNQPVTINNQNLSFVKLLIGVSWLPFLDTMHPSFQIGPFVAAGPVLSLNTDDNEDFLERWQKNVEMTLAPFVRAGLQAKVMTGHGSSYNFRLGYDYTEFDEYIDSKKVYKGLFFQLGMELISR